MDALLIITPQPQICLRAHTHDWVVALGCSKQVDVVYIDFSRAFDSIVFAKLLLKLQSYGVDGKLLQWIGAFLSPRVQ